MRVTLTELHRRDAGKPRCRNAHALPDALALAARPKVESDRPHGVTQSGYRGACAQTFLGGRIRCRASTHCRRRERERSSPRGRAELVRVIELDPARQWDRIQPTGRAARLGQYVGQHTGIQVTEETVRVYLHAHDYVCKRPTWTLRRKAEQKAVTLGNARLGRGSVSRYPRTCRTRTSPCA